eukprot:CCRYP_012196-RE/>CCRYP_012196-RE protein AED:0.02 eAED:0.02 QI:303/0.85/0.87/1/0.71/0.62/8/63/3730
MRFLCHWAVISLIHAMKLEQSTADIPHLHSKTKKAIWESTPQYDLHIDYDVGVDGATSDTIDSEKSSDDEVIDKTDEEVQPYDFSTIFDCALNNEIHGSEHGSVSEYYFADITACSLEGTNEFKFLSWNDMSDDSIELMPEYQEGTTHVPPTASTLGTPFTSEYPTDASSCKRCRRAESIREYSSDTKTEWKLESLALAGDFEVANTKRTHFSAFNAPGEFGVVRGNRKLYKHFFKDEFSSSDLIVEKTLRSSSFSRDLSMLTLNQNAIARDRIGDTAHSDEDKAIVRRTDLNQGVEFAATLNREANLLEFDSVPTVRSVIPSHGSIIGGTTIRVTGDGFHKHSAKACLFWGDGANGAIVDIPILQHVSSTEVICKSPASHSADKVYLLVVGDENILALGGLLQSRGKLFSYHDEIEISSFHPESSLTTGNVTVNIFGGPFYSSEGLSCQFGYVHTSALFISPTQIRCQTPQHAAGTYVIEVTHNGQDFTKSKRAFRFYTGSKVYSIYPTHGPGNQAGTNVKVLGENFVNNTSLYCRFGSVVVPATFINSFEIRCSTPPIKNTDYTWISLPDQTYHSSSSQLFPLSHGYPLYLGCSVSFELTNNGQDFTDSGLVFLYQKDVKVVSISRSEGPSRGGTPVFISGSNFVNSTELTCQFGIDTTRAHFLTRESILCFSTPIYGKSYRTSNQHRSLPLLVSNNAIDFAYAGEFTYISSIPRGMYQAGVEGRVTMIDCPKGSYCHDALESNFTLCSPGTYQPLPKQNQCISCPVGYVCSEFGLSIPRICPAGYVCDERGMATAKPCPVGFWCDKGTATFDTECLNSDVLLSNNMKVDTSFSNFGTCFDNSTDDFGLQASKYPAVFWSEIRQLPLDTHLGIHPNRGKYCLDDSCLKLEDSNNFAVVDKSFDYSTTGFALRRPVVCPAGHYCNAGTAVNFTSFGKASPKVCNAFHCPEGSSHPTGVGSCKAGFYCRFGKRKACPAGTFCPNDNMFDPLPCEPGSFNFMIGQTKCSTCSVGHICPSYALKDPVICPPGFVCSMKGLSSPNIRCPAGFYCQNGTQTSDPFRNDTTLRPLACPPGTYCLAGTGTYQVREDTTLPADGGGFTALFAQPCPSGFFCEAASTSAKGSGPCPPGFVCAKGTATPRPTPKGFFAAHIGTIEATACLPGFYAPTIENKQCFECPAGTTCAIEGLWQAEECPPGTYRSSLESDGYGCVGCPQGTWSKNWQVREKGECIRCPTVNFKGTPAFEFDFPHESMPPRFSMDECLSLNSATDEFFYGELVPPYIDVLGRGPHFRSSDQQSLRYQHEAKCYKNSQPHGSLLYQRMADYYGPQFDIQTGYPHQGYGAAALLNQIIATAPPPGYDFNFRYGYFRGKGHGYIDLPNARTFDPRFNCTKGFQLMNTSLATEGARRIVYTDPAHDSEGGYDIEKCPTWDATLECYIDETFEVHEMGECCKIKRNEQRAIFLANDQFYEGTCEADRICSDGQSNAPEAKACDDGFVCDEATTLETSSHHPCTQGYVCGFATTPDTQLGTPRGQLASLCQEGYYCSSGTGTKKNLTTCPNNYFCPAGTASPFTGQLANDALLRLLDDFTEGETNNLRYQDGDTFTTRSDHDTSCDAATQSSLQKRFQFKVQHNFNTNHLEYQSDQDKFSITVHEATEYELRCARDEKPSLIKDAIRRRECNCRSKFFILCAVYRLWKCTSNEPLDNLSFADPSSLHGKRDYWYPHSRIHLDSKYAAKMDLSMGLFSINWGNGRMCKFSDSDRDIGLTFGNLTSGLRGILPESDGFLEFDADDVRFPVRFTYIEQRVFKSYSELKQSVTLEYLSQHGQLVDGKQSNIDPFLFDLYNSLQLIEKHGEKLESFVEIQPINPPNDMLDGTSDDYYFRGSVNWCECQDLLKCPNGTFSEGATSINDCKSSKDEVLSRISLLPSSANSFNTVSTTEGSVDDSPTLQLNPYEVAVLTIDQSDLPTNFTYGEHYQISIYDDCKPCPLRYQCNETIPLCKYPSTERQIDLLNKCLTENRKMVCLTPDGSHQDVETCLPVANSADQNENSTTLLFLEPDIEFCLSQPYFCSDAKWNFRTFRRLCQDTLPNGKKSPIYDCADVYRWQLYSEWRDSVCCSSQASELRGIDSCRDNACAEDPSIEEIIREKMISVFELEYGFTPPTQRPLGELLLNSTLQEDKDHERPLELFNEWQQPFLATSHTSGAQPHNTHKPEMSKPWISTAGCCKCKRHMMPYSFDTNIASTGFPDDKHKPIQITISALARVNLTVVIELLHGFYYSEFIDYFGDSKSTLRVHTPSRFIDDTSNHATILSFVDKSTLDMSHFDLPLNLPIHIQADGTKGIETRFLIDRSNNISIGDLAYSGKAEIERRDWGPNTPDPVGSVRVEKVEFWVLPYIPFFSCDGYGSHTSWSRLLEEHPDCQSVQYHDTLPIEEYAFRNMRQMKSDICRGVFLQCMYEEEVSEGRENLRWYEASPGSTLFYITRDAVSSNKFVPSSSSEDRGRTFLLSHLRNSYDILPLSVDKEMGGHRYAIPRDIKLEIKYFQITKGTKRLVEARVYFNNFCTTEDAKTGRPSIISAMNERGIEPCAVDINGNIKSRTYDLEVSFSPLNWFDLLNRFEFKVSVYFILYTVMGFALCAMGGFVYGANRLLTKLRRPPRFHGSSLIKLVTRPQIEGCTLALIPYMVLITILSSSFGTTNTSAFGFNTIQSKWATTGLLSRQEVSDNLVGRLGSSLSILGFWIVFRGVQIVIPTPDETVVDYDKKMKSDSFPDIASKRAHFICVGFFVQAMMLCFIEFSYSDSFKNHIYRFVVLFRFCSFSFDVLMSNVIKEKLLIAPLMVLIQMIEVLITIGARDFVEFAMSFFIKNAMLVALRLFLYPLIQTIRTVLPRWRMLAHQTFFEKGLTRQQKRDRETLWKKVNEDIELRSEGVEPLLDAVSVYSIEKAVSITVPFMCLLLMYLYPETEIAMNYGINQHELLYYGTFAFYMLPWMALLDAFILSSQELLYGWRVYDYFSYQRWRFDNREERCSLYAQVDESITQPLQSIDVLCFSSQYYFMVTMLTLGFGTNMLGLTICLRRSFNFLGDPVFPFIVTTVVTLCEILYALCVYMADATIDAVSWDGIWKVKHLTGTMDDIVAARLAIGEGRQEDLEKERQEFLAMNSDTFRHKFIEKNRPWVLQHLVELITPRTLRDEEFTGPDGRPLVDFIRDVYSNLMTVGDGAKRRGDRSDISSDDSSDDEVDQRRNRDRTPLDGNKLLIAQLWLQKARKRRVFTKAVSSIIEKRKVDYCLACSRTLSSCRALHAGLSWNGKFDPCTIDNLIKLFEDKYSSTEGDPTLWLSFFRETAAFTTICNICLDQNEQQKLHRSVRHVGAGRPTRRGDISSDDESEDELYFDPIVIVRSSNEGQMMSKWLQASRHRLGGKFPRNGAEKQTQRYLDRLRHRRPKVTSQKKNEAAEIEVFKRDKVALSTPGALMIKRWLHEAQRSSKTRFDQRAAELRSELQSVLGQMRAEDDWIFGVELRLEGGTLKIEGDQILKEKTAHESQVTKQIGAMKLNIDEEILAARLKLQLKNEEIEKKLLQVQNDSKTRKDQRGIELNRALVERPGEEESLREIYNIEMEQEDLKLVSFQKKLSKEADSYYKVIQREIQYAERKYDIESQAIMERSRHKYVEVERNWCKEVSLWLGKASRKIEAKLILDAEKLESPPTLNAKKVRSEQRKNRITNKFVDHLGS